LPFMFLQRFVLLVALLFLVPRSSSGPDEPGLL